MTQLDLLTAQLDRLAQFEPGPFPVVSLYLNLQADDRGRDRFESYLRKELAERVRTYTASGPERDSLEKDAARIAAYVAAIPRSLNGLALFACAAADLFEPIELTAPIDEHRLFISDQPHLYPLAHVLDRYPRYLALLTDTNSARIFVFALNAAESRNRVDNVKVKHHKMGGSAQARYQRHAENFHLLHVKEVVDMVARIVREERIDKIVLSGDEVVLPLLRDQMPKELTDRIVDIVRLANHAPEREILQATIAALHEKDADSDRERVDALLDAYRANGLACVGIEETKRALELGQVDELVITASPGTLKGVKSSAGDEAPERTGAERAADDLITQARNTAARTRFIEDPALLAPVGGVGAFLRFKM